MTERLNQRPYYCVKEVEHLTGRARVTLFRWRKSGYMPEADEYGPNSIGWPVEVINLWLASRPPRVRPPKAAEKSNGGPTGAALQVEV